MVQFTILTSISLEPRPSSEFSRNLELPTSEKASSK